MIKACLSATFLIFAIGSTSLAVHADGVEPETVAHVDLERYAGIWYEIARIPNRFQDHCRGNVTAEYRSTPNGMLTVINRCKDESGQMDSAEGVARVVDPGTNSQLKVSFVSLFGWHLFWGDYWIVGLPADYAYAVVATPDHRYGWVLSRTPTLTPDRQRQVVQDLQQAGYDPAVFRNTAQDVALESESGITVSTE